MKTRQLNFAPLFKAIILLLFCLVNLTGAQAQGFASNGIGGSHIAIDASGNTYFVGTVSFENIPLKNPLQNQSAGLEDLFLAKLSADGSTLLFATYLGGSENDKGNSIAVDQEGNIYVTGETSSTNFPGVSNPPGGANAFVTKIKADGSAIVYTRMLGGAKNDSGADIAVDPTSSLVAVTGVTRSSDFPTSQNAYQREFGAPTNEDAGSAFLTRLDQNGAILYSTFLGGNANDDGAAAAIDGSGNVYLIGSTSSFDFPVKNSLQPTKSVLQSAFIAKFNLNLSGAESLIFSTYLSVDEGLSGRDIAVDRRGEIYALCARQLTLATGLGPLPGSGLGYIAKLTSNGTAILYAAKVGGITPFSVITPHSNRIDDPDTFTSLAVDGIGNVYLTGRTPDGSAFPTTAGAFQRTSGGGICGLITPHTTYHCSDGFVMKLNVDGSTIIYGSRIGGEKLDYGSDIAVDRAGLVYITGYSEAPNFPSSPNAFPRTANLNRFVLKLDARNAIGAAASVSAASYVGGKLAPDSLVAAFGTQLATTTVAAASLPPPFELGGTAVTVRDSKGNQRQAQLLFVSPTQVNFIMPGGSPPARTETVTATITITNANGEYSIGTVGLEAVRPSIFTADSSGRGFAAVVAQRIRGNTFNYESVVRFDPNLNKFVAIPIDLGPETDQIFVELYGTGWRYRSSEGAVKVTIGGVDIPVTYAGLQPTLFGLDQINLKLPRTLAGMGEVDLILTVDGEPANTTRINIK